MQEGKSLKRIVSVVLAASAVGILTGCNDENHAEYMYDHMEESVAIEMEMADIQEPLQSMEQEELAMYEEMLEISEIEEIEPIADQAIASAEERRSMMDQEMDIMERSYAEFNEARDYIDELDEEVVPYAEDAMSAMDDRYDHYQQLHEAYLSSVEMDIELYNMMKDEDVEIETLEEQHDSVNESYEEISSLNDTFNELTRDYNDEKMNFYEAAGLNVQFE
ncbi:lipoprotein, putative [Salisediminibacterium beveridgei]|uniref:Lipoprotein, putative n=1 Tax=Salisediminibacterium beveridgei TaxID=632773 RepID=A0A1D7QWE7_9BACI|nr:lipoprotein, putative [Salisediminibacterium beveridgei]